MPKNRETDQQKREKALRIAVARAREEQGIRYDFELAGMLDLCPSAFCDHKKVNYQRMRVDLFGKMVRRLHLTGRELCAAFGVPYGE